MKSIAKILLTTIVIIFSSCQVPDTSKAKPIESITPPTAHRFTFDGHSYISFKYVKRYSITIIHDPDCVCNKKN